MRGQLEVRRRIGKGIALAFGLALSAALMGLMVEAKGSPAAALQKDRIEASILSFDGKDFVRTKAANTKLEYSSPAYGALVKKHSYVGDATVFGKKYDADYAPLTSDDGKLIGALFVGVAK